MAAADDREDVALSSAELDNVLSSGGLAEGTADLPADNLELYGVWVKVKPETVPTKSAPSADLADLEGAETEESAELTEDEQDILAELEAGSQEPEPVAPTEDDLTLAEMPSLKHEETLTISEEPVDGLSLEEPGAPSLEQDEAALDAEIEAMAPPEGPSASLPSLDEEEIRIDTAEEQTPSLELGDELVLDEPTGYALDADIDLEAETATAPEATAEPTPELAAAMDDDIILEEPPVPDLTEELVTEEPMAAAETSAGMEELEPAGAFEPETPSTGGITDEAGFDMEAEMAAASPAAGPEPPRTDAALILEKIEQELHAIRREISDLKSELTVLRKERDELAGPGEPQEAKAGAGFFGGEEDETIALTGDELDNILSTADVTESLQETAEEGRPPEVDLGPDLSAEGAGAQAEAGVIPEDILERPEADLEMEADTGGADLTIPEEGLVDASADQVIGEEVQQEIQDESSLLSGEPMPSAGLGEEIGPEDTGPIVETEDQELAMPDDLAADLAAEAEAAITEPRQETALAPDEEVTLDSGPDLVTEDLDQDFLATEPSTSELDIELDLGPSVETPSPADTAAPSEDLELEVEDMTPAPAAPPVEPRVPETEGAAQQVPDDLRDEIKSVLAYLDQLLEALPDEKIEEFAKSEYFGVYKKLFVELGLED